MDKELREQVDKLYEKVSKKECSETIELPCIFVQQLISTINVLEEENIRLYKIFKRELGLKYTM